MAIYSQSTFGKMKGKIGNAVARESKGVSIVQSYQPNVSNPRTTGQTTQRNRFTETSRMAQRLSSFLASYYKPSEQKLTPRNQWIGTFMKLASAGNITPTVAATTQLAYSRGTLTDNGLTIGAAAHAATTLTVPFTNATTPLIGTDAGTDTVSYMLLNQTTGQVVVTHTATLRSAGTGTITITSVNATDTYSLVLFFRNTAATANSTSINRLRLVAGTVTVMNAASVGPWG